VQEAEDGELTALLPQRHLIEINGERRRQGYIGFQS
jgi:hypothetical protein